MFKQLGNSTIGAVAGLGLLGTGGLVGNQYYQTEYLPVEYAQKTEQEIRIIQKAANQYYLEYGAWPSDMSELKSSSFYVGESVSPFGSNYEFTVNGKIFEVGVEASSGRAAAELLGSLRSASRSDLTVVSAMNAPADSVIQSYYLARKAVPGCPDCNTLESDVDANGNDITNVKALDVETVDAQTILAINTDTQELTVERELAFGSGSRLVASGSSLVIDSPETQFSGNVGIGGDLDVNGNNINNVGTLSAVDIEAVSAAIQDAEIERLSGLELTYAVGVVQSLSGQSFNYDEGFIRQLESDEMAFNTFVADVVNVLAARIDRAEIDDLTTRLLSAQETATNNLTVTNQANINYGVFGVIEATQVVAGAVNAQRVDADQVVSQFYRTGELNVTGTANINRVDTPKAVVDYADLATFYADNFVVRGDLTVNGKASLDTANVSGKTTTGSVQASTSELGNASATSLSVSGTVSANRVTAQSGDFSGNVNVGNATGGTASFNRFIADVFEGGVFYGDNFITPITSTNNNKRLLDEYEAEWNSCVSGGGCK